MSDHYDVIVIGSGAGGGTARPRARTHRQAHPAARTRRLAASRARELGPAAVWIDSATATPGSGPTGRPGKRFTPKQHYYVGGNTKFYGAILFRMRERDFGEVQHVDGVSPGLADLLRRPRAVLHPGRAALPGARRARRRPDRPAGRRALPVPGDQPRATHRAAPRRPDAAGCTRSTLPERHPARRGRAAAVRRASAAPPATGSHAWSTARPTRRSICVEPALRYPNVTLLTGAYVVPAGDRRRPGRAVDRRRRRARRATRGVHAPTSSSLAAGAINSAALLLRSASDAPPGRARQLLGRGRAAT